MAAGLAGKLRVVDHEVPFETLRQQELGLAEPALGQEPELGPLRTSSYTIYVDLPGQDQEMLLVHGYTGAYDKVSRRVATYLRSLEVRRAPKPLYGDWTPEPEIDGSVPAPSDGAIEILEKRGYLTRLTPAAEEARLARIAAKLHQKNLRQPPSYIIMPTYDCNLRCSYCFQDHMRTDPRFRHLLRGMSPEAVDRVLGSMPQIESIHGLEPDGERHRVIGFFGGEPLLEANRPIIERFIDGARSMGTASFWAVTNGTDLHAYRDLLSPEKIGRLQITLDGPPAEHDRRRIYADGSGTYEKIARNVDMALDLGVRVDIRLNLDRNNISELPVLAEDFARRGWRDRRGFATYTAPIRAENAKTDSKTTFDTWEMDMALVAMRREYPDMAIVGRPDDMLKTSARRVFEQAHTSMPDYRASFCSAHHRMYIFDAFADIYACWERTGDPKIRVGYIEGDGTVKINEVVNHLWRSRTVASNPACRKCRYALHCGGGCAVLAVGKTGRYHANFCDSFAARFRSNVAEAYLDHARGVSFVDNAGRVCDQ